MFMVTNLIKLCMAKLILNHFDGKSLSRVPQWTSGRLLFQTDFRKWLFGTLSRTVTLKAWLSNITKIPVAFKHSTEQILSLKLTPNLSFDTAVCMFIINGYYTFSLISPWTCYFTYGLGISPLNFVFTLLSWKSLFYKAVSYLQKLFALSSYLFLLKKFFLQITIEKWIFWLKWGVNHLYITTTPLDNGLSHF